MSNYSKTTDFEAKDSLPTGDSGKIIRGAEFETEFDAISTAIATKADTAGPTFTGTLTFETISDGTIDVTAFVDEDDMSSNSATLVPTQQSVKAYVDSQVTAQDLDFQADTGGALSIDLDSETMTFTGGTGITTTGSGNDVEFAIDSTVATLTGTQTLTNKTLTSPDVNTPDIDGGTIDGTVIGGTTAAAGSFTTVSATGNITVGGTVDGRDVATDGTKLDTVETNADVTDTANVTAAGALMDSELTSEASVKALNQGVATTDSPTFAGVTVNGTVEFDGLSGTGAVSVTDILDQDDMSSNSATALATQQSIKAYVDSQVATADTLSEVLANGNTTGGTDIAVGTGDDITFADSSKAIFGGGSDLQIYHDGFSSYIEESGAGSLLIRGDNTYLTNTAGTKAYIDCIASGEVILRYDNGNKLETTSTGIDVTGTAVTDGLTVDVSSNGATVTAASFKNNGTGANTKARLDFFAASTRYAGISGGYGASAPQLSFDISGTDVLDINSTGIDVTGTANADKITTDSNVDAASFTSTGSTYVDLSNGTVTGRLQTISSDFFIGTATTGTSLAFKSGNGVERLRINSVGDISFYEDTGTTAKLFWDASAESLGIGTDSPDARLHLKDSTGSATTLLQLETGWNNPSGNKSIEWTDATNTLGRISVDYSAPKAKMRFGSLYNSGYQTSDVMTLTADGYVGIGTSSPSHTLQAVDTSAGATTYAVVTDNSGASGTTVAGLGFANAGALKSSITAAVYGNDYMTFNVGGSGTTERMRIDSSGNLRVGVGNTFEPTIQFTNSGRVVGNPGYSFNGDLDTGMFNPSTQGTIAFANNGSESMRIDSSGNLLVGRTSTSGVDTDGHVRFSSGESYQSATSNTVQFINRNGTDGSLFNFYKGGSTVGSIGTELGRLFIGSDDSMLFFDAGSTNAIWPWTSTATSDGDADNTIDIGDANNRFKDLYLSGGVYLGGTGTANKLDNYEEGTWTPTLTGSTTAPSTTQQGTGKYTKVGNLVIVEAKLSNKDVTGVSGNWVVTGLPFTSDGNAQGTAWSGRVGSSTDMKMAYINSSNEIILVDGGGNALTWATAGTGTYAAVTIAFMVA